MGSFDYAQDDTEKITKEPSGNLLAVAAPPLGMTRKKWGSFDFANATLEDDSSPAPAVGSRFGGSHPRGGAVPAGKMCSALLK